MRESICIFIEYILFIENYIINITSLVGGSHDQENLRPRKNKASTNQIILVVLIKMPYKNGPDSLLPFLLLSVKDPLSMTPKQELRSFFL